MSALPDICRNNHQGNYNSEQANAFIQPKKASLRDRVFNYIESCGPRGATLHEICDGLKLKEHSVSGRLTELKKEFRIHWNGLKRATGDSQVASAYCTSKGQLGLWERK